MKKTLFLTILALSINAFAQNNQPTSRQTENFRGRTELKGRIPSDIQCDRNLGQPFNHQASNPSTLIPIYDSIFKWYLDTLSNRWKIYSKTVHMVYDTHHNLTNALNQSWNGSEWVNATQFTYTYDASKNRTSFINISWNGSDWVNINQIIYTYDANNNQTSELDQNWNDSVWVNILQYNYIYNINNKPSNELTQYWSNNSWANYGRNIYTYDVTDSLTGKLYQSWNDSVWVNNSKSSYTYDVSNKVTNQLDQYWFGNNWVNSEKVILTCDGNNKLISELYQSWNGNAWVNASKITLTYDVNQNLTSVFAQSWYFNTWVYSEQNNYTYDANNIQQSFSNKYSYQAGTKVMGGDSTYYYFHPVLGINELKSQDASITVYPNPSSGKFTISSKSIINSVELYNLIGEQITSVCKFSDQKSIDIDLSARSKGIYIINVHCGVNIYNTKIVVQ